MSFPLKLEGSSFLKLHFQMYGWKYNAKTIQVYQVFYRKSIEKIMNL